ncbi:MAG: hypothetical protein WCP73_01910 [Eubacteriales bacterium]
MKKWLFILLAVCVLFIAGCAQNNTAASASASQKPGVSAVPPIEPTPTQTASASPAKTTSAATQSAKATPSTADIVQNPFFFAIGIEQAGYQGAFLFNDAAQVQATLHINKVTDLKNGVLYELKLDPIEGVPDDRLSLGYFYVQPDKIVKTAATEENLGILKSGKMPDGSSIVCQDKELKDALGKDAPGFHQYITVDGNQRVYHSYNNQTETGYYESYTWEKGRGLIAYRSGFGAEKDSMELQLNN